MDKPTCARRHLLAFVERESEGLGAEVPVTAATLALSILPESVEPALLRKAFGYLLARHEREFWQRASLLGQDHVGYLARGIGESTTIFSQFLNAACPWLIGLEEGQRPNRAQYGSFQKAVRALAKLCRYADAPQTSAECAGVRFISTDPDLVSAACEVMAARLGNPGLGCAFAFYWLFTILVQSKTNRSNDVIQITIQNATEETRRELLKILNWYAGQPMMEKAIRACENRTSCRPGPCSVPYPASDRHPSRAYRFVEGRESRNDGWCRGRPRGIRPEQWPRSRERGIPLAHAFSMKLPKEYRKQGEEWAAIAFFYAPRLGRNARLGVGLGGCEGKVQKVEDRSHPGERRFGRNGEFSFIWLTEAEFAGRECELPDADTASYGAFMEYTEFLDEDFPPEWFCLEPYTDPNVGFQPVEQEGDDDDEIDEQLEVKDLPGPSRTSNPPPSYVSPYSDRGDTQGLFDVGPHLGGTSFAARGLPSGLSAYYLELVHGFGGLDFGGEGNGQLDLLNETWTWQW